VVKEVRQLFRFMEPDHKYIIHKVEGFEEVKLSRAAFKPILLQPMQSSHGAHVELY
jgi:hypothetical protein